jgi:hypothetical protein
MITRRNWLRGSAAVAAASALPIRSLAQIGAHCGSFTPMVDSGSPFSRVHLCPKYGNILIINAIARKIPPGVSVISGGLIWTSENTSIDKVPGQKLAPFTLYFAYAYWHDDIMCSDWSRTGHIEDPDCGVEVHANDPMRSLCGMVFTDANGKFIGDGTRQLTLSWFNPIRVQIRSDITGLCTTSSKFEVPPGAPPQLEWLQWGINRAFPEGMDIPNVEADATLESDTAAADSWLGIAFDGAEPLPVGGIAPVAEGHHQLPYTPLSAHASVMTAGSAEGRHTAQIMLRNAGPMSRAKITITSGRLYTTPVRS